MRNKNCKFWINLETNCLNLVKPLTFFKICWTCCFNFLIHLNILIYFLIIYYFIRLFNLCYIYLCYMFYFYIPDFFIQNKRLKLIKKTPFFHFEQGFWILDHYGSLRNLNTAPKRQMDYMWLTLSLLSQILCSVIYNAFSMIRNF